MKNQTRKSFAVLIISGRVCDIYKKNMKTEDRSNLSVTWFIVCFVSDLVNELDSVQVEGGG